MLLLTAAIVITMVSVAACSGPNPFQAAKNAPTTTIATPGTGVGQNVYLPDRNVSDCVGTNEKPNCGSPQKGGTGMYLTFGVLILGLGFVMWRISLSVRARDAVVNEPDPTQQPGTY